MVRGQKGGQCRKRQEGSGRTCYRKLVDKPDIAGRAEVGSCHSGGRRSRRSVRGGRRRSVRGGRRSARRSVRGGRRSARRSARGGNYGCKQPNWGPECL